MYKDVQFEAYDARCYGVKEVGDSPRERCDMPKCGKVLERAGASATSLLEEPAGDDVVAAVALIQDITDNRPRPSCLEALEPSLLVAARGAVAFVFKREKGAVMTVSTGRGFIINKLVSQGIWSAPLFFTLSGTGMGLSLGAKAINSLLVLKDQAAVRQFLGREVATGCGSAAGRHGKFRSGARLWGSAGIKEYRQPVAGVGMCSACSPGTKIRVDDALNEAVYGAPMDPFQVLTGRVQAPASFQPVYRTLNYVAQQAADAPPAPDAPSDNGSPSTLRNMLY